MGTIIKTVKQYSYELDEDSLKELEIIGVRYRNAKNYIYSRFSGINSILLIEKPRDIRDSWVKSSFPSQWKLPARYWKIALSEVISNIKTTWSNIKKRIREVISKNQNLSKEAIYYINYVLKANKLYHKVLINEEFELPKIFSNLDCIIKCNLNNIKFTYTNPAYTSKICNICNSFGERKNDIFKCQNCGEIHADVNASKNILKRKDDKEITLYTSYRKVKEILISRAN